jgi:hypothetical protein
MPFACCVVLLQYQQPQPQPSGNDWSNIGDVDMAFGMWMDFVDGSGSDDTLSPAPQSEEEVQQLLIVHRYNSTASCCISATASCVYKLHCTMLCQHLI